MFVPLDHIAAPRRNSPKPEAEFDICSFCKPPSEESRYYIHEPWTAANGKTYATDGAILIETETERKWSTKNRRLPDVSKVLIDLPDDLPWICAVTNRFAPPRDRGRDDQGDPIKCYEVCGCAFADRYVDLIRKLPDLHYVVLNGGMHFRFRGGRGLLMCKARDPVPGTF